jgi:hypothetical protein
MRYPMKLVNGAWTRLSWDQAIDEIGDKLLQIRAKSGPDSVYAAAQIASTRKKSRRPILPAPLPLTLVIIDAPARGTIRGLRHTQETAHFG